jgi:hypothetical protein
MKKSSNRPTSATRYHKAAKAEGKKTTPSLSKAIPMIVANNQSPEKVFRKSFSSALLSEDLASIKNSHNAMFSETVKNVKFCGLVKSMDRCVDLIVGLISSSEIKTDRDDRSEIVLEKLAVYMKRVNDV